MKKAFKIWERKLTGDTSKLFAQLKKVASRYWEFDNDNMIIVERGYEGDDVVHGKITLRISGMRKRWFVVEEGEPIFFFVENGENWIARIQLSGELHLGKQREIMTALCEVLNKIARD